VTDVAGEMEDLLSERPIRDCSVCRKACTAAVEMLRVCNPLSDLFKLAFNAFFNSTNAEKLQEHFVIYSHPGRNMDALYNLCSEQRTRYLRSQECLVSEMASTIDIRCKCNGVREFANEHANRDYVLCHSNVLKSFHTSESL